jgi:hypothetical protein
MYIQHTRQKVYIEQDCKRYIYPNNWDYYLVVLNKKLPVSIFQCFANTSKQNYNPPKEFYHSSINRQFTNTNPEDENYL